MQVAPHAFARHDGNDRYRRAFTAHRETHGAATDFVERYIAGILGPNQGTHAVATNQVNHNAGLLECAQNPQMRKTACPAAAQHHTYRSTGQKTRQARIVAVILVAHRIDALKLPPRPPAPRLGRHQRMFRMQQHQVFALHGETGLFAQVLFERANALRVMRVAYKNYLVGLAKCASGPRRGAAISLIDQKIILFFEFVIPILALPSGRGVGVKGSLCFGRNMVCAPDLRKGLGESGGYLAGAGPWGHRHHHKYLCMPAFHHLRRMAQVVVNRLRKNPVQRQRMQRQQGFEIGPAQHGDGRIAQGSNVGCARLLQYHPGLANTLAGADFVVKLQDTGPVAARNPQAPANQKKHGVGRLSLPVHNIAARYELQFQQLPQIPQHSL